MGSEGVHMGTFYVIEVVYTQREGKSILYKKYRYAGPFDTELDARVIAEAENAAIQDPLGKMIFYHVGTVEDIGVAGIIGA